MVPAIRQKTRGAEDAVGAYLNAIGRIALLSREEERSLAVRVQRYMRLEESKQQVEADRGVPLDEGDWARLAGLEPAQLRQIRTDGLEARRRLIEANLRLVVSFARKYRNDNFHFLDLVQEGNLGLSRAVEKFDPSMGWRFATYAQWWIRQSITRLLFTQATAIRLPASAAEKLQRVRRIERSLYRTLGRTARREEVAARMEMEPEALARLIESVPWVGSLDARVQPDRDTEWNELLVVDGMAPFEAAHRAHLRSQLQQLVDSLPPREARVIALRFGLLDGCSLSQSEVGRLLGVSRGRISQLERRALARLRELCDAAQLQECLEV